MAITPPPGYTPAPTPHPVRNDRTTFSDRVDAFNTWFISAIGQVAAMVANAYNNALEAYSNAGAAAEQAGIATSKANEAQAHATAAAAASNAPQWVTGTIYAEGVVVWSPSNYLPYRRKAPGGVSNTDPVDDASGWESQTKSVAIKDEGGNLVAHATSINIVGTGVTATAVGGEVTITVSAPTVEDVWAMSLAI